MYHRTGVLYKVYWAYSRMTSGGVYIIYLLLITIFNPLSVGPNCKQFFLILLLCSMIVKFQQCQTTVSVFPLMQTLLGCLSVFVLFISFFVNSFYQAPKYINNRRLILISTTTLTEIELTYNNIM